MTQEKNDFLLKDLCARLPYGIKLQKINEPDTAFTLYSVNLESSEIFFWKYQGTSLEIADVDKLYRKNGQLKYKPYLRPMSSITDDEKSEINAIIHEFGDKWFEADDPFGRLVAMFWECGETISLLNSHHLDYMGLIPMGLALEAPEGMYETQE